MIRMFRELCSAILCVTLMIVPFSEVTQARRALPYSRSFASEARGTPTPASRSALGKAASSAPIRAAAAAHKTAIDAARINDQPLCDAHHVQPPSGVIFLQASGADFPCRNFGFTAPRCRIFS